jgi:hypothetical protein
VGPTLFTQTFKWTEESGLVVFEDSPILVAGGAISDDASFVVGFGPQSFRGGVWWSESEGMQPLGFRFPNDISGDGTVVVGADGEGANRVIRWTQGTGPVDIGISPGVSGKAFATNRDGSAVVGQYVFKPDYSGDWAFVWTAATGMKSIRALLEAQGINLNGWRLQYAVGVSDDGTVIAGEGVNPEGAGEAWIATLDPSAPAKVLDRHVFYNQSSFDGNDGAAGAADDGAVAADKQPRLAGAPAGFTNITSYDKGLNGVMIDVAGLPQGEALSADDFDFGGAGAPVSVSVRRGAGTDGSDRVTLVWPDYNPLTDPATVAVGNGWLQVTVKANAHTGLASPDVFSFGNLIGETGDGTGARVSALDLSSVKRSLNTNATASAATDFNRDGRTNALDLAIVKRNLNRSLALADAPAPAEVQMQRVISVAEDATVRRARRLAEELLSSPL